eukprot:sb/3463315/
MEAEHDGIYPIEIGKNQPLAYIEDFKLPKVEQKEVADDLEEIYKLMNIEGNGNINEAEKKQLKTLIKEYQDIFSTTPIDIGVCTLYNHKIKLKEDKVIRIPPRPIPSLVFERLKVLILEMLEAGILEHSDSDFNSPIVPVKKPSKPGQTEPQYRFCLDFRALNDNTKMSEYPLPRINELQTVFGGAKYYSSCDLASSFYQVPLAEESRDCTTFRIIGLGTYRLTRMVQGAKNSAFAMQNVMDRVFEGIERGTVKCYIDDILSAADTVEAALDKLRLIFERLRWANLKLSAKKCYLLQSSITFCGVKLTQKGIEVNKAKIQAIQEMAIPKTKKQVQSFLGAANFWRKFINKHAEYAKGLTETLKSQPFKMTKEAIESFTKLKECLTKAPILGYPNEEGKFILDCDASDFCIGACLSQEQGDETKPIAYASKCLGPSEIKWAVFRKEFYAIYFFVNKFRWYLFGRKFTVNTDHKGLTFERALNKRTSHDVLLRWALELSTFEFDIIYKKGSENNNADMLSRLPHTSDEYYDFFVENIIAQSKRHALPLKYKKAELDKFEEENHNDNTENPKRSEYRFAHYGESAHH